jgi:hypothetical protein
LSFRGSYTNQSALAICRWQSVVRRLRQLSQYHVLHSKSKPSSTHQNNNHGDPVLGRNAIKRPVGKVEFSGIPGFFLLQYALRSPRLTPTSPYMSNVINITRCILQVAASILRPDTVYPEFCRGSSQLL